MLEENTTSSPPAQQNPQHFAQADNSPSACVKCGAPVDPAEVAMRPYEDTGHLCLHCYARMEARQCDLEASAL